MHLGIRNVQIHSKNHVFRKAKTTNSLERMEYNGFHIEQLVTILYLYIAAESQLNFSSDLPWIFHLVNEFYLGELIGSALLLQLLMFGSNLIVLDVLTGVDWVVMNAFNILAMDAFYGLRIIWLRALKIHNANHRWKKMIYRIYSCKIFC
jgi:hypothetical protein